MLLAAVLFPFVGRVNVGSRSHDQHWMYASYELLTDRYVIFAWLGEK
jgi:hypothetical protein